MVINQWKLKYKYDNKSKMQIANHERVPRQGRVKFIEEIRESHLRHHQIIAIAINDRPIEVENYRNPSHLAHRKPSSLTLPPAIQPDGGKKVQKRN